MTRAIIIPDCHASPQYDNERFHWLGKFVEDKQPDSLLCLGDWWEYKSLCSHEKPIGVEGKRVTADSEAGLEAMDILFSYIDGMKFDELRFTMGNHDGRPQVYEAEHPELQGSLPNMADELVKYGWEVTDFKDWDNFLGWRVSHYHPSGIMGKPIGGKYAAASHSNKLHVPCIAGHSHTWDYFQETNGWDNKECSIVAGCFVHPAMGHESWCRNTSAKWDRCITVVDNCNGKGWGEVKKYSMETLERRYG